MPLKFITELLEGDDRQRLFGGPADLHAGLTVIELASTVPEHVRTIFDTARNLSLCTWFVYEFHPMADLAGFLALEAALKAKAKEDAPALIKEKSFYKLMDHALAAGWIAEERIEYRREIARARVEHRKAIDSIRAMEAQGAESMPLEEPTEAEVLAEERDMKVIEGICKAGIKIRNGLAHGELMLDPGSVHRLRMTADLINQLFATSPAANSSGGKR